jgi:hypothetical protein
MAIKYPIEKSLGAEVQSFPKTQQEKVVEIIDAVNQLEADVVDVKPYKVYTAIISQSSTNAPTVYSELENTIGNLVWSRNAQGRYFLTLTGAFPDDKKVVVFFGAADYSEVGVPSVLKTCQPTYYYDTANRIAIESYLSQAGDANDGVRDDGLLSKQHIEVRVYN